MKSNSLIRFMLFYFFMVGATGAFAPYINVYLEESKHLTGSEIGMITALSCLIGICIVPLWGMIGDRTQKYKLVLRLSMLGTLVALYFYYKASVYPMIILSATLLECLRLVSAPMSDTITTNYCTSHNLNYGVIRAMGSLGYMLSGVFVGYLADYYGLDGPMFAIYALLLLEALLLTFILPKEKILRKHNKHKTPSLKRLLTNKQYVHI